MQALPCPHPPAWRFLLGWNAPPPPPLGASARPGLLAAGRRLPEHAPPIYRQGPPPTAISVSCQLPAAHSGRRSREPGPELSPRAGRERREPACLLSSPSCPLSAQPYPLLGALEGPVVGCPSSRELGLWLRGSWLLLPPAVPRPDEAPPRSAGPSSSGLREPLSSEGPAQPPSLWPAPASGGPLPGMLLVPKAQGLVEMLQTIYETESCFSADGMPGREPSLEILPRTPLHGLPVAGKCLGVPACPLPLGILVSGAERLAPSLTQMGSCLDLPGGLC